MSPFPLIATAPRGSQTKSFLINSWVAKLELAQTGVWRSACDASGMPEGLRIHDLRHTAASLLVSAVANVKVVQRHLGHSTATQTLDCYAHLFTEDLEAVADLYQVWAAGNEESKAGTRIVKLNL